LKNQILLPLAAMLIASPAWAQNSSIKLSTTALSFNGSSGNVSSQPITITVTGTRPVTVQSVSFSNSTFFLPPFTLPVTLASGQSYSGQVSARPQSTPQTGTATIGTDAGTFTVSLSETATAQQPAAHSVSLTWNAPAGANAVDSYQVERAAAGSTQYAVIGSTTAASTTYSDDSVQSGQTYNYEVRAVDDQGNSSDPSNTIRLAIP
jgi:hypothetical protein